MQSGGPPREYLLYIPQAERQSDGAPLVVLLHGRPGTARGMVRITQMNAVAARENFVVAYPQGLNNEWNAHAGIARMGAVYGLPALSELPQDDIGFLQSLVDDVAARTRIDRRRVYLAGFSNGGFMTLRMACSAPNSFAAFAEVGAELYLAMARVCRHGAPAPILFMNGQLDPSIPFDGVFVVSERGQRPVRGSLSAADTLSYFIRRNGCDREGRRSNVGANIVRFAPQDCPPRGDLEFYIIKDGGHTWPGVTGVLGPDLGPVNTDINASEVIWEFFSRHTLDPHP